jgi:chorismate mutase
MTGQGGQSGRAVRAVRGATQVDVDEKEHVLAVTRDLVAELLEANKLVPDDVISIVFSATRDVSSVAPALAARQLGLHEPALLCLQEMHVEGAMPRLVRLLAHVETELPPSQVQNIYQRGTHVLRGDVPAVPKG